MRILEDPIELDLIIQPKYAAYLGGAIFLAIVLGVMLGSALLRA